MVKMKKKEMIANCNNLEFILYEWRRMNQACKKSNVSVEIGNSKQAGTKLPREKSRISICSYIFFKPGPRNGAH